MSTRDDYPKNFRIVGTLRAPDEATEATIREVFRHRFPVLRIESIELIEDVNNMKGQMDEPRS